MIYVYRGIRESGTTIVDRSLHTPNNVLKMEKVAAANQFGAGFQNSN